MISTITLVFSPACGQVDPAKIYGELFRDVQLLPVFRDSKKFPDCIPKIPPREITRKYHREKSTKGFDLAGFVTKHFDTLFAADNDTLRMLRHIEMLWDYLERPADNARVHSSLIPLPHPYIVPGGRFREMYYWDSYFTMLGLQESGRYGLMQDVIDNFCFLMDTIGHVPNGNRTYYTSRSQPPFFSLMVELLAQAKGTALLERYLPWLEKEYSFWMRGKTALNEKRPDTLRVVRCSAGRVLNRYFDARGEPRPESYKEDVRAAGKTKNKQRMYRDLRAAAESGWDFSSRWFSDLASLESIHTTDIVPVDLNSLLYHLESLLADIHEAKNQASRARKYREFARERKEALITYCWSDSAGYFFDYDFRKKTRTAVWSMAGVYPLFFGFVDSCRAAKALDNMSRKLLKPGGLTATANTTGQQWDAPNGWAPLQWIGYCALCTYGRETEALDLAKRWTGLNIRTYFATGKMMEKYNVENPNAPGGGGEYELQDGFGWTNGVFVKLWNEINTDTTSSHR